ncbi:MAG: hypothetical protein A2751_04720 [Candidatus Doudnabacteria bacterium RIFCSPHIGHO2_01_FULL_46_14]|uniref:Uncharacterized protein n=1 Tax=Candidatus Doudnabacteria bacterium RIFCSPHIGHO2_01_FULL_46_14 TaxID=1817824 RepID=A0A1F5NNK6_9BACT|nr:MAG: hypothetical protein A2751_04720 [Candidatus Doudnabacteria bacterium RIFCSPHIGHO2_01_FULL_46_14]
MGNGCALRRPGERLIKAREGHSLKVAKRVDPTTGPTGTTFRSREPRDQNAFVCLPHQGETHLHLDNVPLSLGVGHSVDAIFRVVDGVDTLHFPQLGVDPIPLNELTRGISGWVISLGNTDPAIPTSTPVETRVVLHEAEHAHAGHPYD